MYSHTWWMYLDGQACQWNAHFHHLLSSIKEEIWGCERKEDERKNGYNRCGGEETRQKWGKGWCRERKNGEDENMQIVLKIEYILDAVSIAKLSHKTACSANIDFNLNWWNIPKRYFWEILTCREVRYCKRALISYCYWWWRYCGCVTFPSVLTNYLHSMLYHFPSNAATPHFSCLETICKYETEKRRKSGDWRICFVFALYLHYRLRNDSLIRSVVHVFIVITRRLWHS